MVESTPHANPEDSTLQSTANPEGSNPDEDSTANPDGTSNPDGTTNPDGQILMEILQQILMDMKMQILILKTKELLMHMILKR